MKKQPQPIPYGAWPSDISAQGISSASMRFGDVATDGGSVYWIEGRPAEQGRSVIVRTRSDGTCEDVLPAGYNARSRVHEYGGGAFWVHREAVYFSNDPDARLYRILPGREPEALTVPGPWRYADGDVDPARRRLLCVVEEALGGGGEPANYLAAVSLDGGVAPRRWMEGHDFFSNPRLSPDGRQCCWLAWDHPSLPWYGTELWVSELSRDGDPVRPRRIAGGPEVSVFQPQWAPGGDLYFVSDQTGWWNLYCWDGTRIEHVLPLEAEMGLPQWVFGMSTYAIECPTRIVCAVNRAGIWALCVWDVESRSLATLDLPFTVWEQVRAAAGHAYGIAASPGAAPAVVAVDLCDAGTRVLRTSGSAAMDAAWVSLPESIAYPTGSGATAHAFYYPPLNPHCVAPAGTRPPLIVKTHGGPTSGEGTGLDPRILYWTSRGFAVLVVNYRGSTGFGRAYRVHLDGAWGVADVEDCVEGARFAVARGLADPARLIISGGSAGGFTVLAALANTAVFRAGASYYGISDLEGLTSDTHKFEARYLDRLIAPYPSGRDVYRTRSPIHRADRLRCPVIFLQGLEDRVVPPAQAERMVEALEANGLPVAYVTFPGEQHGFRRAENICRALEAELYFYGRVLELGLPDPLPPVRIRNLKEPG